MAQAVQPNQKGKAVFIDVFEEIHPFYTCGDKVRGIVRVEPSLRPSRVSLTFKGFSVIYDGSANGATPTFFTKSQDLFVSSGAHGNFDILQRGTASDGKVELPFEFTFPHSVEASPPADRNWHFPEDPYDHPRYQHTPGFPLPPSCGTNVAANKALVPRVTYAIDVCMDSADTPKVKLRQELRFIPPAPEYDVALRQPMLELGTRLPKYCCRYKFIRTRRLLPNYAESSKLEKVRDILVEKELFFGLNSYTEVPFARFNVLATPARVQVIGSNIPVVISVQHLDRSASLPDPPELFMRRIRIQLLSAFHIFVPRTSLSNQGGTATTDTVRDTIPLLDRRFDQGSGYPLRDGLNLADLDDVQLAHRKLLPSFTSYGLALEYELQVEIWGECARHEFAGICCRDQVQIVSGWNAPVPQSGAVLLEADSRPVYQELDPMAGIHESGSEGRLSTYVSHDLPPPPPIDAQPRPLPPPYVA